MKKQEMKPLKILMLVAWILAGLPIAFFGFGIIGLIVWIFILLFIIVME